MAITDAFKSAVSASDIRGLRIMMKDSLLVDPTFNEFNEMDNIAKGVSGLYEAHDGRNINNDTSSWDDNYMNKLMVQVVGNFSRERVDHLKKVVKHLRPVTRSQQSNYTNSRPATSPIPPAVATHSRESNYQEQKRRDEQSGRITSYRGAKIAVGAVAGGVVGGAIAGFASISVLTGAVAGAVAVGAVVAIATNGE